jgi:hypothetical protein
MQSHPNLDEAPRELGITARFQWLVENQWEILPEEKGGATIDKRTYRMMPPAYHALVDKLNQTTLMV